MATDSEHLQPSPSRNSLIDRLHRARHVLLAAAVVFAGLALLGTVTLAQAVIGFVVVGGATLIGEDYIPRARDDRAAHDTMQSSNTDVLLDTVISALPDPALVLNREGLVIALNARALALAPALRRGEPVSIALRMPEVVAAIRQAITNGTAQRVEFSERVPVERWSEAFVTPFTLAGSATPLRSLVLVSIHDLTPLRRVEEMRVDFVANASHELRTPLASLSGFIETLQGSARDDAIARARFLGIMKDQATRMARLIDDLLSLSRIELNVHIHPQTPVDLMPVIRQVADSLQMLARDRGVEIEIAAPAAPVVVPGDRDELIRVFENLVENALKYGASGKRVEITLTSDGAQGGPAKEVAIAVRDYGPGIAREYLPRLTERFYRVDVAESRAQGGTGLGLALVKHILARHRGRLTIESEQGNGATFTVRLPLRPDGTRPN
jgi:two-component system, OmpR family, phosphate regulon sensor histidine kinase PhoR